MIIKNNSKLVALTFDDGPSDTTPKVLDILEKQGVVASFFLIGNQVTKGKKAILKRQLDLGCEIANHSFTHSDMSVMDAGQILEELNQTSKVIKEIGEVDVKFFRPPYIALSDLMFETINLPFIQGMGCEDWEESVSPEQRIHTVLTEVKDGTIIILHDLEGNENTVKALPAIIEGLKEQGYTFVTVSRLFEEKGVNPDVEHKIWTNVLE